MPDEAQRSVVEIGIQQPGDAEERVARIHLRQHPLGGQQLHAREQRGRRERHLLHALDRREESLGRLDQSQHNGDW